MLDVSDIVGEDDCVWASLTVQDEAGSSSSFFQLLEVETSVWNELDWSCGAADFCCSSIQEHNEKAELHWEEAQSCTGLVFSNLPENLWRELSQSVQSDCSCFMERSWRPEPAWRKRSNIKQVKTGFLLLIISSLNYLPLSHCWASQADGWEASAWKPLIKELETNMSPAPLLSCV